jgi:hypothetical protein
MYLYLIKQLIQLRNLKENITPCLKAYGAIEFNRPIKNKKNDFILQV